MVHSAPVWGQFSRVWGAEELQIGQRCNLFARWDGRSSLDGVFLELPAGWTLQEATALRQGYEQMALQVRRGDRMGNQYVISASRALRGAHDLIFRIQTGGTPGHTFWTLTPFQRRTSNGQVRLIARDAFHQDQLVRQTMSAPVLDNRVLAFRGDGAPWLLQREALPDLGTRAAYSVEFWLRTTDFNEVLLSTWTGDEHAPYPLELIVDAGGRLRFYRGQPGRHESMVTQDPVADGQWHHIALTHEGAAGWTRLFLDGAAADSLVSPVPLTIAHRTPLALGARLPSTDASVEIGSGYTGLLDELHFWPRARRAAEIRRTMRQPVEATEAGVVFLGFEEPIPSALIERRSPRTERVSSDLALYHPVRNVQAVLDGEAIRVTWETRDQHTTAFVVERSTDGRDFQAVGDVAVPEAISAVNRVEPFSFLDPDVASQVVFYRIRQRFDGGAERLSGAIKLGLGRVEQEQAVLLGNFPNPFNPTTTIVYEVRETQRVRVSVWDLSGQQVAMLVDQVRRPGSYDVRFDGGDLPSGTYFVRLQNPQGPIQTHKMILMK
ncbi:MAG: LamG-like jellyroll fold domain-containing protein [Rhodothermales bacterium]